ncbi:MAG TPA: hypothetical protein VF715_02055 [Thermoleophilaceae bacterium]|jgi:hypothetical protein
MRSTFAVFVVAFVGYVVEDLVRQVAENHPLGVGIVGAVAVLLLAAIVFLLAPNAWMAAVALVAGAWFIGLVAGLDARDNELGDYCRYGARSAGELDRCMSSVTTDEIGELDTPAARFARGWTDVCGQGSGPYCAEVARHRAD